MPLKARKNTILKLINIKRYIKSLIKTNKTKNKLKIMKKSILALSLISILTACNTSTVEETAPLKDSVTVCVDSISVNTPTLNIDTIK